MHSRSRHRRFRSQPVSRVLSRQRRARTETVIPLGMWLPACSSPLPVRSSSRLRQQASTNLACCLGAHCPRLLRAEIARFTRAAHLGARATRLVSVALILALGTARQCRRACCGRALPAAPLCGARTFLPAARDLRTRPDDGPADFERWCPRSASNRQARRAQSDFKSDVFAIFTTRACEDEDACSDAVVRWCGREVSNLHAFRH